VAHPDKGKIPVKKRKYGYRGAEMNIADLGLTARTGQGKDIVIFTSE